MEKKRKKSELTGRFGFDKTDDDVSNDDDKTFVSLRSEESQENSVAPYLPSGAQLHLEDGSNWQDAVRLRTLRGIQVEGRSVSPPFSTFAACGLKDSVLAQLEKQGCIEPTPVQMQVLPCVLQGRDVMIRAETGSGKTLAYLLPLLCKLDSRVLNQAGDNPIALIIVPTRELVEQIYSQLTLLLPNQSKNYSSTHAPIAPVPAVSGSNQNLPPVNTPYSSSFSSLPPDSRSVHRPSPNLSVSPFLDSSHTPFTQNPSKEYMQLSNASFYGNAYNPHLPNQTNTVPFYQTHSTFYEHNQSSSQNSSIWNTPGPMYNPPFFQQNASSLSPESSFDYSHPYALPYPPPLPPLPPLGVPVSFQKGEDLKEAIPENSLPLEPQRERGQRVLGVVGGVSIGGQIRAVKAGVDVLIATPGRLLDLLEKGVISLAHVSYLVLDEVDRMLGEGMDEQLRQILSRVPEKGRQTVLVSATIPIGLENLAMSALVDSVHVTAGEAGSLVDSVQHEVIFMHTYMKKAKLLEVLRYTEFPPVIIFCNSTASVDSLVQLLRKEQFHVAGLHSSKCQPFRFRCMKAMREGKLDVLVATDVASRGIDVTDVTRVINYEMPDSIENYIHRCGRTGRTGKDGMATSFLTLDCTIAKELRQLLQHCGQPVPPELFNLRQFGGKVIKTELGDMTLNSGKFSTD